MSTITIYNSRGEVRETTGEEKHSDDDKDNVRNLFLDLVYYVHIKEINSFYIFYQVDTGMPEQAIVKYQYDSEDELFTHALKEIRDYITKELGWSIIKTENEDWYQLITHLESVDLSTQPNDRLPGGDYQINVIKDIIQNDVFDLGTPNSKTATDVIQSLLIACEDVSIAVAGKGRSRSTKSVQIMITPSKTRSEVEAIDGSHEKYSERYDDSLTRQIIDVINSFSERRRQQGSTNIEKKIVNAFEEEPYSISRHGHVAKSKQTLKKIGKRDEKITAIVVGLTSFLGVFTYSVDTEAAVESFTNQILTNTEAVSTPLYEFSSPNSVLILTGLILALLLILAFIILIVLPKNKKNSSSNTSNRTAGSKLSLGKESDNDDIAGPINKKLGNAKTEPSSSLSSIFNRLSENNSGIEANIKIMNQKEYKKSRLFAVLPVGLMSLSLFALTGFLSGIYTIPIINSLITISIGIIYLVASVFLLALFSAAVYVLLTQFGPRLTVIVLVIALLAILLAIFGLPDFITEFDGGVSQAENTTNNTETT